MLRLSNNPRAGKIKIRIFALVLLILSCSLVISAFRSLGREFYGLVIRKSSASGITSDHHWLMLLPTKENQTPEILEPAIIKAMADENYPLHRVGVSSVVYQESQPLSIIKKEKFSPTIAVNSTDLIDLGVNWMLLGIGGILLSLWMYWQTLSASRRKYEDEAINVPGLQ